MDLAHARRLLAEIPEDARVLDVGGGASPFPRADHVLDAVAFEALGSGSHGNAHEALGIAARYSRERWTQFDICSREPWPFADKSFDFAVCSHVLEDVRDPIWICSELARVARAGSIEVPSRVEEQSRGVEHPRMAGFSHHRWLISRSEDGQALEFRHKPHALHAINDAIVANLSPGRRINPEHAILVFGWEGTLDAREVLQFQEREVIDELCRFARKARQIKDLTVRVPMPLGRRLQRHVYFARLAHGGR